MDINVESIATSWFYSLIPDLPRAFTELHEPEFAESTVRTVSRQKQKPATSWPTAQNNDQCPTAVGPSSLKKGCTAPTQMRLQVLRVLYVRIVSLSNGLGKYPWLCDVRHRECSDDARNAPHKAQD